MRRAKRLAEQADRRAAGRQAERVAARYLRRRGYRLLARNLRMPHGEVDLLVAQGSRWAPHTFILVEVKSSAHAEAELEMRVRPAQWERLRRNAAWLRHQPDVAGRAVRIDLIGVLGTGAQRRIRHLEAVRTSPHGAVLDEESGPDRLARGIERLQ